MQAEKREPDVVAAASAVPAGARRYSYFRLRQHLREQGVPAHVINDTSLAFPVADVRCRDGDGDGNGNGKRVIIKPAFMGLLGIAGALPYRYTERIAAAADSAPREFVDMLSARALEQFDEAWHKHRPSASTLRSMLAALKHSRTTSAETTARTLSDYFRVPVRIEQFVPHWTPLAQHDRCRLGTANCTTGQNAALGERQWRCDLRIRLHVGPLAMAEYEAYLPPAQAAAALKQIAATLTGGVQAEACIALAAKEVKDMKLDGRKRLGYNAFLLTSEQKEPRSELRYRL